MHLRPVLRPIWLDTGFRNRKQLEHFSIFGTGGPAVRVRCLTSYAMPSHGAATRDRAASRRSNCYNHRGLSELIWKMKRLFKELLALGMCFLLSRLPVATASAQTMPARIDIVVIEGEGAINNVRQRVARDPVVRVEDENHRPVAGAAVVFTLPVTGPGGEFSKGSKTLTVMTSDEGTAAAHGLKLNQVPGKLQIHVTASYRGLRARALINQTLEGGASVQSRSSGGGSGKWIAILAAVGGAAAGGAILATRKGSSSSGSTPTTPSGPTPIGITPGTPSLTHP